MKTSRSNATPSATSNANASSNATPNANATPLVVRQAHHERSMRAARPEPVEGRVGVPAASPTPTSTSRTKWPVIPSVAPP